MLPGIELDLVRVFLSATVELGGKVAAYEIADIDTFRPGIADFHG